jgi:hypothetical protein
MTLGSGLVFVWGGKSSPSCALATPWTIPGYGAVPNKALSVCLGLTGKVGATDKHGSRTFKCTLTPYRPLTLSSSQIAFCDV